MYNANRCYQNVSKGRRALATKVDSLDQQREYFGKKNTDCDTPLLEMSGPRPVFQHANGWKVNYTTTATAAMYPPTAPQLPEDMPQQSAIIKYMQEIWLSVMQDFGEEKRSSLNSQEPKVVFFKDQKLEDDKFVPFNLEGFWGQRMFQQLQKQQQQP